MHLILPFKEGTIFIKKEYLESLSAQCGDTFAQLRPQPTPGSALKERQHRGSRSGVQVMPVG